MPKAPPPAGAPVSSLKTALRLRPFALVVSMMDVTSMVANPATIADWLKLLLSQDTIGTVNSLIPWLKQFSTVLSQLPVPWPPWRVSESPTFTMVGVLGPPQAAG